MLAAEGAHLLEVVHTSFDVGHEDAVVDPIHRGEVIRFDLVQPPGLLAPRATPQRVAVNRGDWPAAPGRHERMGRSSRFPHSFQDPR